MGKLIMPKNMSTGKAEDNCKRCFRKLNFSTTDKPVQPDAVPALKPFVVLECLHGRLRESDHFNAISQVNNTTSV